jgi:hypothetical protein
LTAIITKKSDTIIIIIANITEVIELFGCIDIMRKMLTFSNIYNEAEEYKSTTNYLPLACRDMSSHCLLLAAKKDSFNLCSKLPLFNCKNASFAAFDIEVTLPLIPNAL